MELLCTACGYDRSYHGPSNHEFVRPELPGSTLTYSPVTSDQDETLIHPGLERELGALLNSYSAENASNTPDFILAEYLIDCLRAYNSATRRTREWKEN